MLIFAIQRYSFDLEASMKLSFVLLANFYSSNKVLSVFQDVFEKVIFGIGYSVVGVSFG